MTRKAKVFILGMLGTLAPACTLAAGTQAPIVGEERAVVVQENTVVSEPGVFEEPPTLVAVEQDVYVVEDSDVPIYYVDGRYWSYRAGGWYSADTWYAPWVVVTGVVIVPEIIVHRDHDRYAHYRGDHDAHRFRDQRERPREEQGHQRGDRGQGHERQPGDRSIPATHEHPTPRIEPRPAPRVEPPPPPKIEPRPAPRIEPRPAPRIEPPAPKVVPSAPPRPVEITPPRPLPAPTVAPQNKPRPVPKPQKRQKPK